jgi:diphthamide synthase subunit DPH2
MNTLKRRIKRVENNLDKPRGAKKWGEIIVVSTKPGRENQDLAKARTEHGEKHNVIFVISYIPEPAPLPDEFKNGG